jgi:hypothetical protein
MNTHQLADGLHLRARTVEPNCARIREEPQLASSGELLQPARERANETREQTGQA